MSDSASEAARPVVVVTEGSDARPLQWLRERAEVVEVSYSDAHFGEELRRADGLVVRTYTTVNKELLAAAPRLRVVGRGGVGLENIDVAACRARGVEVVYTPEANTVAVGEFVFGAILRLVRPWYPFASQVPTAAEFKRIRNTVRGRQLNEMTLGVLGMGHVGKRVGATAVNGFGMRVIYNDVVDVGPLSFQAESVSKERLYAEADVLSLHVDMRPGNEKLVGPEAIALMKRAAVLINTSRGEVLDEGAVAQAVRAGKLSGVAIDVFDPEPPGADFPLLGMENVLLTPHLAARTYTAIEKMSWVVRDVLEVLEGRRPRWPAPHQ